MTGLGCLLFPRGGSLPCWLCTRPSGGGKPMIRSGKRFFKINSYSSGTDQIVVKKMICHLQGQYITKSYCATSGHLTKSYNSALSQVKHDCCPEWSPEGSSVRVILLKGHRSKRYKVLRDSRIFTGCPNPVKIMEQQTIPTCRHFQPRSASGK